MRQPLPVERSARTRGLGPVCRYWDRCVALTWRKQSFSPARSEPVALQRLLTPGTDSKMTTHPGTRGFKERCPQSHGAHSERGIRIPGEMLKIHSQWTRPPTSPPPRSEPGSVVQCRAGAFTFLNVPFSKCGVPSAPDAGEPVRGMAAGVASRALTLRLVPCDRVVPSVCIPTAGRAGPAPSALCRLLRPQTQLCLPFPVFRWEARVAYLKLEEV